MRQWRILRYVVVGMLGLSMAGWAYPGLADSGLGGLFTARPDHHTDDRHAGFLGVVLHEVDADTAKIHHFESPKGVLIGRVMEGLAGSDAGLERGDVVTHWDGQAVIGMLQFKRIVKETPPGRAVDLNISREGKQQTLSCIVGSRAEADPVPHQNSPNAPGWPFEDPRHHFDDQERDPHRIEEGSFFSQGRRMLGVKVISLEPQLAGFFGIEELGGVLVTAVQPDSVAEKAGLVAGDVIMTIEGRPVNTPMAVSREVNLAVEDSLVLRVVRQKETLQIEVTLKPVVDEKEGDTDSEASEGEIPEIGEGSAND